MTISERFKEWRLKRLRRKLTKLTSEHMYLTANDLETDQAERALARLEPIAKLREKIDRLDPPAPIPESILSTFRFKAPAWANTSAQDLTAEAALARAAEIASGYYPLGVQTGIHSMIEWCGVMTEYVKMLEHAYREGGHDPREVDQHHESLVQVPDFMISYFCEKLGCQLKPFIGADTTLWMLAIRKWFPGNQAKSWLDNEPSGHEPGRQS